MNMNDYQRIARSTADYPDEYKKIYPAFGLCGEVGEVAEKIKKILRDNNGTFSQDAVMEIIKELGDVLWYISVLAEDLGYSLTEVADINIKKLQSRKDRNMIHGNGDDR